MMGICPSCALWGMKSCSSCSFPFPLRGGGWGCQGSTLGGGCWGCQGSTLCSLGRGKEAPPCMLCRGPCRPLCLRGRRRGPLGKCAHTHTHTHTHTRTCTHARMHTHTHICAGVQPKSVEPGLAAQLGLPHSWSPQGMSLRIHFVPCF
uniref:cDNA FLJ20748 fis, clone HEP05772 n=1 Tax=Homo sapiens TaxID=9606 RepID=Q9NWL9_HUMAN